MATLFRWLVRLIALALLVVILGAGLAYYFAAGSLPDYNAHRTIAGISAPVEIVRDTADVPHIFGKTDADVYFALGYAHAQDRLWQMVVARRTVQGRLSEVFGARTLKTDELMRRLDLYRLAVKSVTTQWVVFSGLKKHGFPGDTAVFNLPLPSQAEAPGMTVEKIPFATETSRALPETIAWHTLDVADVNADGWPDVAVAVLLAQGGTSAKLYMNNNGVLNTTDLKFFNEPARHKLLDIVGDLALVGRPIKGHILAARPGHFGNTTFAKRIKERIREEEKNPVMRFDLTKTVYDINQIEKILPHRYPFLLVDRIVAMDKATITGIKNITLNEPQFTGHFPGNPVMPGVLQVEAMAQVGGIFALSQVPDPENYTTYFLKIDGVRFKRKVIPGDTIVFHLHLLTPIRRGIVHMKGVGYVNGQPCVEAEMMAQIARDKAPKEEPVKATATA